MCLLAGGAGTRTVAHLVCLLVASRGPTVRMCMQSCWYVRLQFCSAFVLRQAWRTANAETLDANRGCKMEGRHSSAVHPGALPDGNHMAQNSLGRCAARFKNNACYMTSRCLKIHPATCKASIHTSRQHTIHPPPTPSIQRRLRPLASEKHRSDSVFQAIACFVERCTNIGTAGATHVENAPFELGNGLWRRGMANKH